MLAAERFRRLLSDLALSADDRAGGLRAHRGVRATLQGHYYGYLTIQDHSRLVGAWAKGTEVLPARSIDLLFALPKAVREREWTAVADASVQRQMLDEIESVLRAAHGTAKIRPDGRAVASARRQTGQQTLVGPDRRAAGALRLLGRQRLSGLDELGPAPPVRFAARHVQAAAGKQGASVTMCGRGVRASAL